MEFMREDIMAMCPNNIVVNRVPKRDDGNRLIGASTIELPGPTNNYRRRKHPTKDEKRETNFM